jgi:hypothetical protein
MVDGIRGSGYDFGFANLETQHPYVQVNAAVARNLPLPRLDSVEGRISVVNLFDHVYLIRQGSGIGIFSPQYEPRRALYFTLTLPFGKAPCRCSEPLKSGEQGVCLRAGRAGSISGRPGAASSS